jgi:hypothetical protein
MSLRTGSPGTTKAPVGRSPHYDIFPHQERDTGSQSGVGTIHQLAESRLDCFLTPRLVDILREARGCLFSVARAGRHTNRCKQVQGTLLGPPAEDFLNNGDGRRSSRNRLQKLCRARYQGGGGEVRLFRHDFSPAR